MVYPDSGAFQSTGVGKEDLRAWYRKRVGGGTITLGWAWYAFFGTVVLHEGMDGAGIRTVEVSHYTLYM